MANVLCENGFPIYALVSGQMVEVQEVRHGRWIHKDHSGTSCSKCGSLFPMFLGLYDYCPNCGTRMDLNEVTD